MAERKLSTEERRNINHREYQKYMNEKVEITIPIGAEKPGTTTTASCDGTVYEIELGKTVMLPRKIAEIVARSIKANEDIQLKIDRVSGKAVQLGEY